MKKIIFLLFIALIVSACGDNRLVQFKDMQAGNSIFDVDQVLNDHGTLMASKSYSFTQVDGKPPQARRSVQLSPGTHTFTIARTGDNPSSYSFHLDVKPNRYYVFRISGALEVYPLAMASHQYGDPIQAFLMKDGDMVDQTADYNARRVAERDAAKAKIEAGVAAAYNRKIELMREAAEKNRKEMPFKRKIGAEICQDSEGKRYLGYVEALADEKVKIRIAQAFFLPYPEVGSNRLLPVQHFNEQIVWAFPSDWFLCGDN